MAENVSLRIVQSSVAQKRAGPPSLEGELNNIRFTSCDHNDQIRMHHSKTLAPRGQPRELRVERSVFDRLMLAKCPDRFRCDEGR